MKQGYSGWIIGLGAALCGVIGVWVALMDTDGIDATTRFKYEHLVRITAALEFDGELIEIDSLFDCRTKYEGPASRAVQLGFDLTPSPVAYETRNGGMILLRIPPTICGQDSATWAGYEKTPKFPEAWLPVIQWFDNRDLDQITKGESYWSEAALKNPNGRIKVIESFRLSIPETSDALLEELAAQKIEHGLWRHDPPILQVNGPQRMVAWPRYIKVPREEWSQPPAYLRAPDRPADPEGLRDFLDALPRGEGLMYIGDSINYDTEEAITFSINDLLTGRWGNAEAIYFHGIPQREEEHWGMYLNERSWKEAQIKKERLTYFDDWIPLDFDNGKLVLRVDTPGMGYRNKTESVEFTGGTRELNFLGKPFVNGPYTRKKSLLIFDLETRDLWVGD